MTGTLTHELGAYKSFNSKISKSRKLTLEEVISNQMTTYEGKEHISMKKLDAIIHHFTEIYEEENIQVKDKTSNTYMTHEILLTQLKKYQTNRLRNKTIHYQPARNRQSGRLFVKGQFSGQSMCKKLRHTLFSDTHIDIDIVNCHPVLLSWYCHHNDIPCDKLDYYIHNRDNVISEAMTEMKKSREDIKTMILSMMNGGNPDHPNHFTPFINNFHTETKRILTFVLTTATEEERKNAKREKNMAGSILNHRLCEIENYILKKIVEFFQFRKFKDFVLCFDGLMVNNKAKDHIEELNNELDRLGIPGLMVVVKPMDKIIDLSRYISKEKIDLPMYPQYDNTSDYCLNHLIREFGSKSWRQEDDFIQEYIPKYNKVFIHFSDRKTFMFKNANGEFAYNPNTTALWFTVENHKIRHNDFIEKYSRYLTQYTGFNCYPGGKDPFGEDVPENVFNTFTGFKAQDINQHDPEKISKLLYHLQRVICKDDDILYHKTLDWFSAIIQTPWKQTKVMPIWYSEKQQAGKGIISHFMVKYVIGEKYGAVIDGINPLVTRFNGLTSNYILVFCNELRQIDNNTSNSVFESMKAIVTDPSRTYEVKGGETWNGYSYINCIGLTNNDHTYKVEEGDCRIFPIEVSNEYAGNHQYFEDLKETLNQETANHFYTFLKHRIITDDIRNIPETSIKKRMKEMSCCSAIRFTNQLKNKEINLSDLTNKMDLTERADIAENIKKGFIRSIHLFNLYHMWCGMSHETKMSSTAFYKTVSKRLKNRRMKYGMVYDVFFE